MYTFFFYIVCLIWKGYLSIKCLMMIFEGVDTENVLTLIVFTQSIYKVFSLTYNLYQNINKLKYC